MKIKIPGSEFTEEFIRASGPGGQHVNKTASAVQLRFNVHKSSLLSPALRARLTKIAGSRINSDGELIIEAKRYRSQDRNRADARQRLHDLIARAAEVPKPRKKTKPSRAAKRRRLNNKKQQARKKGLRQKPGRHD